MRSLLTLLACSVLGGTVLADDIVLRDGRTLVGRVMSTADGKTVVRRPWGEVTFVASKIVSVTEKRWALDDYEEMTANLPETPAARMTVAKWCKKKGLVPEMKHELGLVIATEPDHAAARALLGHVRVEGKWMTRAAARRALGLVRRGGKWVTREEAARLESARKETRRLKRLERRLNGLVTDVYSLSEKRSDRARDALLKLAKAEKIRGLDKLAGDLHAHAIEWRHAVRTATIEIRAQQASITGFRTFPVSLGTGSQVRIQLPELRRVSIGSTVVVPVR